MGPATLRFYDDLDDFLQVGAQRRFALARSAAPFTRCLTCNGRLPARPKEELLDRLPPETRLHYDAFLTCLSCRRVFWWGPHSRRLREIVEEALRFGGSGG